MASSGSTYISRSKVRETVPQGVQVPMCFCGSLCKLMKSRVLGDDFGMRFFMCENYEYDPPSITARIEQRYYKIISEFATFGSGNDF